MLKKLAIAFVLLVVLFFVVGFALPKDYEFTRKITVQAPPERVHELVGELKRWDDWTPWKKVDPTVAVTFGPTTTGVGASQTWTGKDGGGRLVFSECDPRTGIVYDMAFIDDGQELPSKGWVKYTPSGAATEVEWGMRGTMDMPVIGGYFAAMMGSMMAGPMFEQGLADLKAKLESK